MRYFESSERSITEKLAFFVRQGVTTKEYAIFRVVRTQYYGKTCFFRKTRRGNERNMRYFESSERSITEKLAFFVRQGVTTKEYAIFRVVRTQYYGKTCFFRKTRRGNERNMRYFELPERSITEKGGLSVYSRTCTGHYLFYFFK